MTQAELNRAVARATGESIAEVKRIGFLLAEPDTDIPDPDDEDLGQAFSIGTSSTRCEWRPANDTQRSLPRVCEDEVARWRPRGVLRARQSSHVQERHL